MTTPSRTSLFRRATTLVEVLVVIVVFTVGILAVVQIFPGGFRVLTLTRKGAMASALARQTAERLKSGSDGLPAAILAVGPDPANVAPNDLGPLGTAIATNGALTLGGVEVGDWNLFSGANRFRQIVDAPSRIPSPRQISPNLYGSLLVLPFGPLDLQGNASSAGLVVKGNDLVRNAVPEQFVPRGNGLFDTVDTVGETDFFTEGFETGAPVLYLPCGLASRGYRVTVDVTVTNGGAPAVRTLRDVSVVVAGGPANPNTGQFPLRRIELASYLTPFLPTGDAFQSISVDSLRVSRAFAFRARNAAFSNDPFEYKVLNADLGILLFNPTGYAFTYDGPNGREPLRAVCSYRVRDWRILREDVRLSSVDQANVKLAMAPIRDTSISGNDGRTAAGFPAENAVGQSPTATFVSILDVETGGTVMERDASGRDLVRLNKSLGLLQFLDANGTTGGTVNVRIGLLDGTTTVAPIDGRALRILYMPRDEFAVQVIKPADAYAVVPALPNVGQCYVGGGAAGLSATRLYFPTCDAGQKVTISELRYVAGGTLRRASGQALTIRRSSLEPLPFVDLADVDPNATGFATTDVPVRGVRGASMTVRAVWNPTQFALGANGPANLAAAQRWSTETRKSALQTFIAPEGGNDR